MATRRSSARKKSGKSTKKGKPPRFSIAMKSAKLGAKNPELANIQKYLSRFGYLDDAVDVGKLDRPTSNALVTFQRCHGLKATGALDKPTIDHLQSARCSVPDVELAAVAGQSTDLGASGSFTLRGCKYNKQAFTYRFLNGTGDVAGTAERAGVRRAFQTWADALCIRFTERTSDPVDFLIGWFTGNHGDGSAFDGAGNTLAHAFYPPPCGGANAGALHFDDAEAWSLTGAGSTFDIETVALHEIGHLLGLAHSSVAGSVMFPTYGGLHRSLTQDDLDGIRRLYPYICRRGDSGSRAGFVREIAAVKHRSRQVITATRTQAGTLKLIAWIVLANGSVRRTGDSGNQAGRATFISIARGSSSRYVTAVRTSGGTLKLISWGVNAAGSTIRRRGDSGSQAGRATLVNIVALSSTLFVTAVRTQNGRLRVISWRLNANGALTRLGDSGNRGGAVSDIALVKVANNRVVTAVRTSAGTLKLISWQVTSSGTITRKGDSGAQAGRATQIRATVDRFGNVVTAVRTSSGNLRLISWRVPSSGTILRRGDTANLAGKVGDHDVTSFGNQLISATRTDSGILKLIAWRAASRGPIGRIGDSDGLAGSATLINLNEPLAGSAPIVTSVRTQRNTLKLITWRPRN
jgi:hypothetical protein